MESFKNALFCKKKIMVTLFQNNWKYHPACNYFDLVAQFQFWNTQECFPSILLKEAKYLIIFENDNIT